MASGEGRDARYSGVFDGHLQPGRSPALLLVDMVVAYTQTDSPLYCETAASALEIAATLAQRARQSRCPVVLTNVVYEPGGADGGVFYRKVPALRVFTQGSPLGAFSDILEPEAGDLVVTKKYPSAFFATGLAETLRHLDVDTVVIGGFSTSGCVRASALDAMQYGFLPFVVRDACADRHPDPHDASLFDLQAKYAEVVTSAEAEAIFAASS